MLAQRRTAALATLDDAAHISLHADAAFSGDVPMHQARQHAIDVRGNDLALASTRGDVRCPSPRTTTITTPQNHDHHSALRHSHRDRRRWEKCQTFYPPQTA